MVITFKKDQIVLCVKGNSDVSAGKHYKVLTNFSGGPEHFLLVQDLELKCWHNAFAHRFVPVGREPEEWL